MTRRTSTASPKHGSRWFWRVGLVMAMAGCHDDHPYPYACANGTCVCTDGVECMMPCASPPCHVVCAGPNTLCHASCANGDCTCAAQSTCYFTCAAPPCHVTCQTQSTCSGACANGECSCESGSQCQFRCDTPPCRVTCAGNNPLCDGECAGGGCDCGPNSTCHFTCQSGPCHVNCAAGSQCTVACPASAQAGTQNCVIDSCGAGSPRICPDGVHMTCGAPCPT